MSKKKRRKFEPEECEEDPLAIGPIDATGNRIMRRYFVAFEESESYSLTVNGELGAAFKPCGLNCQSRGQTEPIAGPGESVDLDTRIFTSYRFDVFTIGSDAGDATVEIVRQEP